MLTGHERPSSVFVIRARVMLIRTGTSTLREFLKTSKYKFAPVWRWSPSGCLPPSLAAWNLLTKILGALNIKG